MKKILIKLLTTIITISVVFICNQELAHIHADDGVVCPICGATASLSSRDNSNCEQGDTLTYTCTNQQHSLADTNYVPYTFTVEKAAWGHSWDETDRKEATCTEDGYINYVCKNCQNTKTDIIPAMGHDLEDTITKEATCTEDGTVFHECSRCDYESSEIIPKLGHDYKYKIISDATCEADGVKRYTCTRCKNSYDETIKKLGHDYEETERLEPTCTEDGYIKTICKNCKDEHTEVLKALGHIIELKITKEATCTEDGEKSGVCETCGETIKEVIPAKGHNYPDEWTIDKEASIFAEGQESKTCEECGNVETQVIPKQEVPVAIPVGVGGVSAAAIAFFALKKAGKLGAKKAIEKTTKNVAKEAAEEIAKDALEPEFEERTIVTCMKQDDFYKSMKSQKYLVVVEASYEELSEAIEENEPAITLIDVTDKDLNEVKENLESIKTDFEEKEIDLIVSLLVSDKQLSEQKELLDQMKADELIKDYAKGDVNASVNLVKLILPVMKPDLKSDEALDNIGMVADALGIPSVSTIISMYVSGREIKATIDDSKESEDGLGMVDKATIISDLASILGLDTISSVAGLVGDVDDIKSSLEAKVGANEINTTKDAATDIIDVVSDIIDR